MIMIQTDEERKAKRKDYEQRPEVKAKKKAREQTPENRAKRKEQRDRPENKAKRKKYNVLPERIAKQKERRLTSEYKARTKARTSTPEYKTKRKSKRYSERLKVLQYYSKDLSKSDIPCCRCCGESHNKFLAIDHIAGRKQMDSEPELLELGYSSSLASSNLIIWIIKNNFPKGFQILCHNCNVAKGHYGECPHERK